MNPFIPWGMGPCTFPCPTEAASLAHVPWSAGSYGMVHDGLYGGPEAVGTDCWVAWWQHFHQCFHSGFCRFEMMTIIIATFYEINLQSQPTLYMTILQNHSRYLLIWWEHTLFSHIVMIHTGSCILVGSFGTGATSQIHGGHRVNEATSKSSSFKSRLTHIGEESIERFALLQFVSVWMHRKCIFHQMSRAAAISP